MCAARADAGDVPRRQPTGWSRHQASGPRGWALPADVCPGAALALPRLPRAAAWYARCKAPLCVCFCRRCPLQRDRCEQPWRGQRLLTVPCQRDGVPSRARVRTPSSPSCRPCLAWLIWRCVPVCRCVRAIVGVHGGGARQLVCVSVCELWCAPHHTTPRTAGRRCCMASSC